MEVVAREQDVLDTVELSDYELDRNKPMPSKNHAIVQSNIGFEVQLKYRETYRVMSEVKLNIPNDKDVVPDIAIYPRFAFDPLHDEVKMTEMPLCAVEILSPSQTNEELIEKVEKYFSVGVKSCWLVIPTFQIVSVFSDASTQRTFFKGELYDEVLDIRIDLDKVFR
jgi:Uma2 family endonuclease